MKTGCVLHNSLTLESLQIYVNYKLRNDPSTKGTNLARNCRLMFQWITTQKNKDYYSIVRISQVVRDYITKLNDKVPHSSVSCPKDPAPHLETICSVAFHQKYYIFHTFLLQLQIFLCSGRLYVRKSKLPFFGFRAKPTTD